MNSYINDSNSVPVVRRLTPRDAPGYRALMLQAYALAPQAFTSSVAERAALPIGWWKKRLHAGLNTPEVVFGAETAGQLAGVVGLSFDGREKARHKANLFGMYVMAGCRQQGLGGLLVQTALDFARARSGIQLVQLTVTQGNSSALALYQRHGFVEFGVEPMAVAVGDGYVAKTHMWCLLDCAHVVSKK